MLSTAYLFLILPGVVTPVPKLAPPLQRLASMLFNRQAWKLFFFQLLFYLASLCSVLSLKVVRRRLSSVIWCMQAISLNARQ